MCLTVPSSLRPLLSLISYLLPVIVPLECAATPTAVRVNAATKQRPPAWTPTRGLSDAPSAAPAGGARKPDWPVGTPAPGRAQTLGEAFAAMQHHARGTRKVGRVWDLHTHPRIPAAPQVQFNQRPAQAIGGLLVVLRRATFDVPVDHCTSTKGDGTRCFAPRSSTSL